MKITGSVHVVPAYGRDYKSAKAATEDFKKGLDFQCSDVRYGSGYVSIRDFAEGSEAVIRYKRMTMCTIVKV